MSPRNRRSPQVPAGGAFRELPPRARADLLRVLTSPAHVRADVIRQFYERPGKREMAEVLLLSRRQGAT
jgi:hypothetical protein